MLKGKKVFISGGSGYLGSALCRKCYEYGAEIVFSYHKDEENAKTLEKEMIGISGIKIDLKNIEEINTQIDSLHSTFDGFDILINNAGVSQVMPFSLLESDDLDYMIDINVKGTFFLTKAIVRKMVKKKMGAIVNIGSIAGQRMFDVPVHYAMTKSSVSGFTYSLAAELKRFNIRVNSVIPGMLEDGVARGIPEEMKDAYLNHCAVGRPGTASEVAEVVSFLASEKASYVNAQNVFVDGGI